MNTNSALLDRALKTPSGINSSILGKVQSTILGGGWTIVDFAAADNCCLYITTMKKKEL